MAKPLRLFVISIFLLSGCDHSERIAKLEKENQELKSEATRDRTASEYDLQAKCSKDAKVWFKENWTGDKDTILLDYTNHYHKGLNKCLILVEYHYAYGGDGSWMKDLILSDVYENSKYGGFSQLNMVYTKPVIKTDIQINSCELFNKKCKTADEFNDWVRPYLSD